MSIAGIVISEAKWKDIGEILARLINKSRASCVVLTDRMGQIITQQGYASHFDTVALAAFAAGDFASAAEMAKNLGNPEFTSLFHQGQENHIYTLLLSEEYLLITIFDERTIIGRIRMCAQQSGKELSEVLLAEEKEEPAKEEEEIEEDIGLLFAKEIDKMINQTGS